MQALLTSVVMPLWCWSKAQPPLTKNAEVHVAQLCCGVELNPTTFLHHMKCYIMHVVLHKYIILVE